jgi:hypothetical protein
LRGGTQQQLRSVWGAITFFPYKPIDKVYQDEHIIYNILQVLYQPRLELAFSSASHPLFWISIYLSFHQSFLQFIFTVIMRIHALFSLLALSAYAAPLLQPRDNLDSLDGVKDLEMAYKQMGKAYENAMMEYSKSAGKSGQDLTKAYADYAKAMTQLANDASKFVLSYMLNLEMEYTDCLEVKNSGDLYKGAADTLKNLANCMFPLSI